MFTIKNILVLVLLLSFTRVYGQKFQTETTMQYDKAVGGVSIQRLQFDSPDISVKYDSKVDLTKKTKINDVFGVFFPNTLKSKNMSVDLGFIKTGDWDVQDELFVDVTTTIKLKNISLLVDMGQGLSSTKAPRSYILSRVSHSLFTVEAGFMSSYGYSDLNTLTKNQYYWVAIHPKYVYLAAGNEITRDWFVAGSKDLQDFGILGCGDYDRANGNFWVRVQTGIDEADQKFFCLDNYLVSSSYLILPPFFYKHFSPVSTKGNFGLKFDGIKTGAYEKYEFVVSHKFGKFGNLALGWEREVPHSNGVIIEYYKDINFGNFKAGIETKYESLYNRLSGFIRASVNL